MTTVMNKHLKCLYVSLILRHLLPYQNNHERQHWEMPPRTDACQSRGRRPLSLCFKYEATRLSRHQVACILLLGLHIQDLGYKKVMMFLTLIFILRLNQLICARRKLSSTKVELLLYGKMLQFSIRFTRVQKLVSFIYQLSSTKVELLLYGKMIQFSIIFTRAQQLVSWIYYLPNMPKSTAKQ